jgi:outer membrane receptor for ferrienterochelin and colicins
MRIHGVFFVLFLLLATAFAQQKTGTIRVQLMAEGKSVAGAEVTINGTALISDPNGIVLTTVPADDIEIVAGGGEYVPTTKQVRVTADELTSIAIDLEKHEEDIVVSATRTGVRLDDQPTRVEVLNRDEIEEKMLMTPGDIVMMLNEMGGMRVQSTSPSLGAASVRIQGMRGRYTRFLSDGLPLYGQQVGGLGLLQIPPMDLGQVEVIKGVASSMYGAGAMGGVVNLVSRRPSAKKQTQFLINQSTRGATDGVMFLSLPLNERWSMSLLGGAHFQLQNDIDNDGWADLAGYQRGILRPRFYWEGANGSSFFLTTGVTVEDRTGGTVNDAVLPATGQPYEESLRTRGFDVGVIGQRMLDGFLITGRFAIAHRSHDHQFGDVGEHDSHDNLFAEVAARRSFSRHTLVGGIAIERDAYNPTDVRQFEFDYAVPGIFVQDDVSIANWLSASLGARWDHHNVYGDFFSPRISLLARKGNWSSRLSAGQGFFASTPLTEETEAAGLTRLIIPQQLQAERGSSASFDLTRTQGNMSFTATLFGSRISHPLFVERTTSYQLTNLTEATTNAGVELLATFRPKHFSVTASYTFVQSRETENGTRVESPLTPRHSAGLVGMWESEEKGRIGLEVYYTGKQRLEANPYQNTSQDYLIVGALLERRLGRFRVFLNAENLTGVRQTRWNPLLRPTQGPDGRWTVDAWAPLDGRVFNGGVRMEF